MNTHDIEPLKYGGDRSDDYVTGWNDCYAAIEADRQRRDEPVAWINEDELPASYPYDEMFGFSEVREGVRMFPVFWPGFVITPEYLDGHRDGLEWAAQIAEANHPLTGDWLYDDPHELAKALRKGPEMPPATPQPAEPVKCEACRDSGIIGHSDICPCCKDTWGPAEPVKVPSDELAALDLEHDDYVRCTDCGYVGLVRLGQDECPACGEESLQHEPKPDSADDFLSGVEPQPPADGKTRVWPPYQTGGALNWEGLPADERRTNPTVEPKPDTLPVTPEEEEEWRRRERQ